MFAKLLSTFWKSFLWVRSEKRPGKSAETAWLLFKIRISLLDQSQNLSSDRSFCSGAGGCIFIQMLLCSKRRLMDQKCQTEACRFFNQFSSYSCFFHSLFKPITHILQNAQVTSNKMVHKKRHHFLAQFSIPFQVVSSVLCEC